MEQRADSVDVPAANEFLGRLSLAALFPEKGGAAFFFFV
jgi:hypothetical protein